MHPLPSDGMGLRMRNGLPLVSLLFGRWNMTGYHLFFPEKICFLLGSFFGEMSCIPCQLVCSSASQDRAGTNSPLSFEVVGGWELGHPIFVSTVEPNSIPERAGLRVGDQVSVAFLYSVWEVRQFPLPCCVNGLESSFFSYLLRSMSLLSDS